MNRENSPVPVDWAAERALMIRVIQSAAKGRLTAETIEDLAQDACIGVMRAVFRGGVENLEALSVTIARYTAIKALVRQRKRGHHEPLEDVSELSLEDALGRLLDRGPTSIDGEQAASETAFYVSEVLKVMTDSCGEVMRAWMDLFNLKKVADRLGITHDNARARFSRCCKRALHILRADDGPLGSWARERAGVMG